MKSIAMCGPASVLCIVIPAINLMTAAIKRSQSIAVSSADRKGTALLNIKVVTSESGVVIVYNRRSRECEAGTIAHADATAHLGGIFLGRAVFLGSIIARDGNAGAVGKCRPRTAIEEKTCDLVVGNGNLRGSINIKRCVFSSSGACRHSSSSCP